MTIFANGAFVTNDFDDVIAGQIGLAKTDALRAGVVRADSLDEVLSSQLDLKEVRMRTNAYNFNEHLRKHAAIRGDAAGFNQNAGYHLARELEYIHEQELEEKWPLPTSLEIFGMDNSVPVGAKTHTVRRTYDHGEARVYKGPGDKAPRSDVTRREESRDIRHIVGGYAWDIFEEMGSGFANSGLLKQRQRVTNMAMMRLANRLNWGLTGSQYGIYGVLNYPYLPRKVASQAFTEANVVANPDLILRELHAAADFPEIFSDDVFYPDTMVITNRVHRILSTVRFGAGSDTTILQHFLENSAHIKQVKVAWELKNVDGTAGQDGIFFCRTDEAGVMIVMPQGITPLPVQSVGFENQIPHWMSVGGVTMWDVLNNLLFLVTTDDV